MQTERGALRHWFARPGHEVGIVMVAVFFLVFIMLVMMGALNAPALSSTCQPIGHPELQLTSGDPLFTECLAEQARSFLENDYQENRDLTKTLLTTLVAVFVASITFSESLVKLSVARPFVQNVIFASWVFLLFAILGASFFLPSWRMLRLSRPALRSLITRLSTFGPSGF